MGSHRSTTLGLFADRCPAALDHYERGTPYDRTIFAAGIAAHAVLQAAAEQPTSDLVTLADDVTIRLTSEGRGFDGRPEGPLPIEAALEGRALALAWLPTHPIPEGASAEHGYAVDADWNPVPYRSPAVRLRAILDLVYPAQEEIDGEPMEGVAVQDYKTAWPHTSFDTLQLKIQAVLAVAHAKTDPAFVRREVGNLRTGQVYSDTLWLDEAGYATLAQWRREIKIAMSAADVKPRRASPGACCCGCPYLTACPDALEAARTAPDDAVRLSVLDAERAALRERLKAATGDAPIKVPGGVVGYRRVRNREPIPGAALRIAARWLTVSTDDYEEWKAKHADWTGLLTAVGATMASLGKAAKALYPRERSGAYKTNRETMIGELSREVVSVEFGVWPNVENA